MKPLLLPVRYHYFSARSTPTGSGSKLERHIPKHPDKFKQIDYSSKFKQTEEEETEVEEEGGDEGEEGNIRLDTFESLWFL